MKKKSREQRKKNNFDMIKNYLLKILDIDSDGNTTAKIIDKKLRNTEVLIPYNKQNPVIKIGDTVSSLIKYKKKRIINTKILKKIYAPKPFFAKVNEISSKFIKIKKLFSDNNDYYFIKNDHSHENLNVGEILKASEEFKSNFKNLKTCKLERVYKGFNSNNFFPMLEINELNIIDTFPTEVIKEVEKIDISNIEKRSDLTNLAIITIDGDDAKDFDDAVFVEKYKSNKWKVIVSIADVSHYVQENSNLDTHAKERGNSIYFPNFVIPMLPEKLSNDLCSLKENKLRLTLSVEIILDSEGNKLSHKFFKSTIKSAKRFTYNDVNNLIKTKFKKNKSINDNILLNVKNLYQVYKKLKNKSSTRGALALKISDTKILFDKKGKPLEVQKSKQLESHQIIEELMILANECAAEELQKYSSNNPYRIHERPKPEKILSLINCIGSPYDKLLKNNNVTGNLFNKIIEQSSNSKDFIKINELILRAQSQARYHNENKGHFGLSLKNYVHFTSPIRRYSDLIVHRKLTQILENNEINQAYKNNLSETCTHISSTERKAVIAERNTIDRYIALIYSSKNDQTFSGEVISVKSFGIFVKFDNHKSEGFIPKRLLPKDHYLFNEKKEFLKGKSNFFKIGMSLLVNIKETDILKGKILLGYCKHL